jgi:phosphoribosyl 1,2-cyclic phosphodiesterase
MGYDRDIHEVDALFISHEHRDHIAHAGVIHRKFGIPLHMTRDTRHASVWPLGKLGKVNYFLSGESVTIGDAKIHTHRTAHDAVDGVAYVIEAEGKRLGILTDLGHASDALADLLATLDAAYLESNYDPMLLEAGEYPYHVKARIRGEGGHLSNEDAADLIARCGAHRPAWITLVHLSEGNNRPDLAIEASRAVVGPEYPLHLAPRDHVSPMLEL